MSWKEKEDDKGGPWFFAHQSYYNVKKTVQVSIKLTESLVLLILLNFFQIGLSSRNPFSLLKKRYSLTKSVIII